METNVKEPEYEYEDAENYQGGSGKDGLNEKEIILKLFQRALMEGSKEMNPGGVQRRLIGNEVMEFVVPDQREIFINSVEMLKTSLTKRIINLKDKEPFIHGKFTEAAAEIENVQQRHAQKHAQILSDFAPRANSRIFSIKESASQKYNADLKNINEIHAIELVAAHKKLLAAISILLFEYNYLGEGWTV